MNQNLDSRVLNFGECYAIKFTRNGKAVYRLQTHTGYTLPGNDDYFTISVNESSREKGNEQQHTITIRRKGSQLYAEPEHLEINQDDIVLWHTDDPAIHNFVIQGEAGNNTFDSSCMEEYVVYSHAFGVAGEYHWKDAYGSKIGGVIKAVSPECNDKKSQAKWLKSLDRENLITICGDKVEPQKLEILTGQTVIWAIEKAPGISITDSRLLPPDNCHGKPQKPHKPVKGKKQQSK